MLLFDYFIWYFAENQQLCHRTNLSFLREKGTYNASRINTIHALIRNIVHYTLGFFFVYALLSTIGVPVGSLLAGAGIAGVALGLGAQGFMNDLITGFYHY